MKLVVIGLSTGECARMTSRSAVYSSSRASEENRRKSSWWVGLGKYGVRRGGMTSAQSEYRWLQKVVPQASLSRRACRSAWRASRGTPGRDVAPAGRRVAPYSLPTCHITHRRVVGVPRREALGDARARSRYGGDDGQYCWRAPYRGARRRGDRQGLRPPVAQPRRRRRGGGGQVHGDAAGVQAGRAPRRASRTRTGPGGSRSAQENTPTVTRLTPASRIRRTSSAHTCAAATARGCSRRRSRGPAAAG